MPELDLGNVKGPQGKSAYQSALDAGYSGSEEAFNTAMAKAPDAVLYTAQSLSDAQKERARGNIGAAKAYTTQPIAEVQLNTDYFPSATSGNAKITKDDAGNVHMQVWNTATIANIPRYGYTTIATLSAEKYSPPVTVLCTLQVRTSSKVYANAIGVISTNGTVQINAGGDLSGATEIPAGAVINLSASWAV